MSETTQIRGYLTSFAGMFGREHGDTTAITRIEIPMIQRDYAQGRRAPRTTEVREAFLDALLTALSEPKPLSLDFVYGRVEDVESEGIFYPLDGQQRLTTLFLLHWYLASESGHHSSDAPWTRFTYATRPSARSFCEQLTTNALPRGTQVPSEWLSDQPWYQYGWQFDPTVAGMLVMLDAIAAEIRRRGETFNIDEAWQRLTDPVSPGISFHLLPIDDMYSDEDLYITMNSRGRPLTDFENFKAQFERIISHVPERAQEFAQKVDGSWADLMWRLDDGDRVIDDEFLRYFTFLIEICEFKQEIVDGEDRSLVVRATEIFGQHNPRSHEHLEFLIQAFDTWSDADEVDAFFTEHFSDAQPGEEEYDPGRLRVFGQAALEGDDDAEEGMSLSSNLLRRCLQTFGDVRGRRARVFSLGHSLLLYGVLRHRMAGSADFAPRLRSLRNLVAGSENIIRFDTMPALLRDVETLILEGDLLALARFSGDPRDDEMRKQDFLNQNPHLRPVLNRLEDNPVLLGRLAVFDLAPSRIEDRSRAFERVFTDHDSWPNLTGALLATGDYYRRRTGWSQRFFGTGRPKSIAAWQVLLGTGSFTHLERTREVLMEFLDRVADAPDLNAVYTEIMQPWLVEREERENFDWRYYLVKYPAMRSGWSGQYMSEDEEPGYRMCMLKRTRMNSYYRDPYLLEIYNQITSAEGGIHHDRVEDTWYYGHESQPRWLTLSRSGVGIRCVIEGFEIRPPADASLRGTIDAACASFPYVESSDDLLLVRIPQRNSGEGMIDIENRITIGVRFVEHLITAGL